VSDWLVQKDAQPWFRQAERDREVAERSAMTGHFEWGCFCCQQAAEKALKAVLYAHGRTDAARTHSVADLARACSQISATFTHLAGVANELDRHYLPTRYPDALNSSRAPGDVYVAEDYERASQCLESTLTVCRNWLGGSSGS
jgi:HEPN domain-containing protein